MYFPFYNPESSRGWVVGATYSGALARWRVSRTLRRIAKHPEVQGDSDAGVRNLLYAMAVSLRPRRILEIGTHIGTATVVIGHALKTNGYGKLLTLEPMPHYQKIAASHVAMAGLAEQVEILPFFSHDPECRERLAAEAPFELIFVDGAHDYDAVCQDLAMVAGLVCDNGIIVCHDSGVGSLDTDPTGKGGVRQALWDFQLGNPDFRTIFLEFPVWLNNTGSAIICKERLELDPRQNEKASAKVVLPRLALHRP